MKEKTFHFRLITPVGLLYDGEADMVIFRANTGDMAILAGHAPLTTVVGNGELRVLNGADEQKYTVSGGFAEVNKDGEFTLLTDSAA